MSKRSKMAQGGIEGAPIALASDLSYIPVVTWVEQTPAAVSACVTPAAPTDPAAPPDPAALPDPAAVSTIPHVITLWPLALIVARPSGVERLPLGGGALRAAALSPADALADRLSESIRQACVDAVFGAPMPTAGGFRVALRRVVARLSIVPGDLGDPQVWRIEILSSEALESATIPGSSGRPALGMSA